MRRFQFRIMTFMRFLVSAAVGFTVARLFLTSFESGLTVLFGVFVSLIVVRRHLPSRSRSPELPCPPTTTLTLKPESGKAARV